MMGEWFSRLSNLTTDYKKKVIFNVDETALFFKCLSDKIFKKEQCKHGKNSKGRVMVFGKGANITGLKNCCY